MSRFASTVRLDLLLQKRYGFFYAGAFVTVVWSRSCCPCLARSWTSPYRSSSLRTSPLSASTSSPGWCSSRKARRRSSP